MTVVETLKRQAEQQAGQRLSALSQQIEAVRSSKAQSIEELAAVIEPLAQAMALLSDDLRSQVQQMTSASRDQAVEWSQHQAAAADRIERAWKKSADRLNEATDQAKASASSLDEASSQLRRFGLMHWLSTIVTGAVTAGLLIGLWIWQHPSPPPAAPAINLDARTVAQYLMQQGGLTCPRIEPRRR